MITNLQLFLATQALNKIMAQPMPVSLAFKFRSLIKTIGPTVEALEETKNEIHARHREPGDVFDESGKVIPNAYRVTPEGVTEVQKLFSLPSEATFKKIKAKEVVESGLQLSVNDFHALSVFLDEEEAE